MRYFMLETVLPHNLIGLHFESSPYVHSSYMHVQACLSMVALRAPVVFLKIDYKPLECASCTHVQ